jgi:hypothetical protein
LYLKRTLLYSRIPASGKSCYGHPRFYVFAQGVFAKGREGIVLDYKFLGPGSCRGSFCVQPKNVFLGVEVPNLVQDLSLAAKPQLWTLSD